MTLYKEKELCEQFETDFFSLRPPGLAMWLAQRTSNQHASLCASLHTACCGITCYDNAQTTFSLGWTERV